jgi:hypothetical protein
MPGGRPAFQPTEEQRKNVEVLAGLGIPEEDICRIVRDRNDKPISKNTLRKYFKKELETAAADLHSRVGNFMIATIFGSKVPEGMTPITDERVRGRLMELYAAQRMDWRKTVINQHEGKAGGTPIVFKTIGPDADI